MLATGMMNEEQIVRFEAGLKKRLTGIRPDVKHIVAYNLTCWDHRDGSKVVAELASKLSSKLGE